MFELAREALGALAITHNGALMINFESLLVIKNPCDFAVAWKSGQPE